MSVIAVPWVDLITTPSRLPDPALYGLITGPFTLALHLQGTELFMKMFDDEDYLKHLMTFCKDVSKKMADYYIESGCDVIALVDPTTSQIGPEQFRQYAEELLTIFPDIHFTIEDLIAERDRVVSHWTATGTQKGEFIEIPATNKNIKFQGATFLHIAGGKVISRVFVKPILVTE